MQYDVTLRYRTEYSKYENAKQKQQIWRKKHVTNKATIT